MENIIIPKLSEGDFWDDLPVEIKSSINQAKEELDNGEGVSHSQLIAEIKDHFLEKK